jgi:hypothetical protein
MTRALRQEIANAEAEAQRHKALSKRHRQAAREAACRRDQLKAKLASLGIGLIELPPD